MKIEILSEFKKLPQARIVVEALNRLKKHWGIFFIDVSTRHIMYTPNKESKQSVISIKQIVWEMLDSDNNLL